MVAVLHRSPEVHIIESQEEHSIEEWQELYPDLWLLLEVTEEDTWEIYKARLIAVSPVDMDLVPLWQEYQRKGKITGMFHGIYTEPGPTGIA
jgi:hypothetical protein